MLLSILALGWRNGDSAQGRRQSLYFGHIENPNTLAHRLSKLVRRRRRRLEIEPFEAEAGKLNDFCARVWRRRRDRLRRGLYWGLPEQTLVDFSIRGQFIYPHIRAECTICHRIDDRRGQSDGLRFGTIRGIDGIKPQP